MNKLFNWPLLATDANPDGGSSNPSDANGGDSSTQQDANQPTEQQQVDAAVKGLGQIEQQAESGQEGDASSGEAAGGAEDQQDNTQQAAEGAEPAAEVVVDKPEDAQLEFHKHPRFQELISEKNALKQDVEDLRPKAQRSQVLDDYLQQNGIQAQELQNALEYLRLRRTDPEQAFQRIKQDYEVLAQYAGEALPPDLQAEVAAATLSPERAKELARARTQAKFGQWNQQSLQQQQVQLREQTVQGAINTWASAMQKRDTAFRPKANGDTDGKWEYVDMKLRQLRMATPPQTMEDAVKLAEQAYNEANKFFARFTPRPKVQKPMLKGNSATGQTSAAVKNEKDVVQAIMRGQRPHQIKYA